MNKYMGWVLYDEPPEGFSIDKHTDRKSVV